MAPVTARSFGWLGSFVLVNGLSGEESLTLHRRHAKTRLAPFPLLPRRASDVRLVVFFGCCCALDPQAKTRSNF